MHNQGTCSIGASVLRRHGVAAGPAAASLRAARPVANDLKNTAHLGHCAARCSAVGARWASSRQLLARRCMEGAAILNGQTHTPSLPLTPAAHGAAKGAPPVAAKPPSKAGGLAAHSPLVVDGFPVTGPMAQGQCAPQRECASAPTCPAQPRHRCPHACRRQQPCSSIGAGTHCMQSQCTGRTVKLAALARARKRLASHSTYAHGGCGAPTLLHPPCSPCSLHPPCYPYAGMVERFAKAPEHSAAGGGGRPNIIVILADDQVSAQGGGGAACTRLSDLAPADRGHSRRARAASVVAACLPTLRYPAHACPCQRADPTPPHPTPPHPSCGLSGV